MALTGRAARAGSRRSRPVIGRLGTVEGPVLDAVTFSTLQQTLAGYGA